MPESLDIIVHPIHRQDGYEQSFLPGLLVASPPRRSARGRKHDRLTIYLHFEGPGRVTPSQLNQIMDDLAKVYYSVPGSATSAMREMAEDLNESLFKRNRSASGLGRQIAAHATFVVSREDHFYLAQCGPVHALLLSPGNIRHFYQPETAGRGLGTGQRVEISFSQAELSSSDLLMLMPSIPSEWRESTLQITPGQSLAGLRRRLMADAGSDLTTVLMLARPGEGKIQLVPSAEALKSVQVETAEAAAERQSPPEQKEPPQRTAAAEQQPQPRIRPEAPGPGPTDEGRQSAPVESPSAPPGEAAPEERTKARPSMPPIGQNLRGWFGRVGEGMKGLLGNLLPEDADLQLPAPTMAFIAVAVPVVVVVIASLVYVRVGRQAQYDFNYEQAKVIAEYALTLSDRGEIHEAWTVALAYIEQAERYKITEESQAVRLAANQMLDELGGVSRLDFEMALVDDLPDTASVIEMVATGNDLYMLDSSQGSVFHYELTGSGRYEASPEFRCGPGQYEGVIVVALVDIAALPRPTREGAEIVGIDSNGVLLYCRPDGDPIPSALLPPDNNWGSPTAIAVENGNLYVLDPLVNAVWVYFGENYMFEEQPRFFFAEQVPSIQEAVDIAMDGSDLFILRSDSSMVMCTFNDLPEAPTTCEDPVPYAISAPGEGAVPLNEGYTFVHMAHTAPPEPSIFLLDAEQPSVYHFSLRLNLAAQYRPVSPLPGEPITSFAVSPSRALFLAIGNEIFVAFMR